MQLVALMSGVVLGGVAEVVGSNLSRGKIFTASIGSVDSLYPSVFICIYNEILKVINFKLRNKQTLLSIHTMISFLIHKYLDICEDFNQESVSKLVKYLSIS